MHSTKCNTKAAECTHLHETRVDSYDHKEPLETVGAARAAAQCLMLNGLSLLEHFECSSFHAVRMECMATAASIRTPQGQAVPPSARLQKKDTGSFE